jgi:hypothetical protein
VLFDDLAHAIERLAQHMTGEVCAHHAIKTKFTDLKFPLLLCTKTVSARYFQLEIEIYSIT